MSKFSDKLVEEAKKGVYQGYTPSVRPACANFVSAMMKRAGWKGQVTNYVPDYFKMGEKVSTPEPGDLVIFKKTYDAVLPTGIGDEDDKTHVGILLDKQNGVWRFAHYSSSVDKPITASLSGYWSEHLETFIRLPDILADEPTPSTEYSQMKMFYHPAVPRPKIVINGEEEWLEEMLITARTRNGTEIVMSSHEYEEYPFIRVVRRETGSEKTGKVKAIEWRLKYEK